MDLALAGGMIPDDRELLADLTGVEYGYVLREGRDAIIRICHASPDLADALALTFAYPVAASDHRSGSSPARRATNISTTLSAGLDRTVVIATSKQSIPPRNNSWMTKRTTPLRSWGS